MKNNKLFSVLIALLVCLTVVVSVSAADETAEGGLILSLKTSGDSELLNVGVLKTDDKLTVDVIIEENPGILASYIVLKYDAEALELDVGEDGKAVTEIATGIDYKCVNGEIRIFYGDLYQAKVQEGYPTTTTNGTILKIKFKAINDVDAESTLKLEVKDIAARNENGVAVTTAVKGYGAEKNLHLVSSEHNHENYEQVTAGAIPACQEGAKENDTYCAFCGKLLKEGASIEKTDCNWVETDRTEPTCTKDGSADYKCSLCGATKTEVLPLTGHDFEGAEWVQTKAPTCGDFGVEQRKCNKCDGTEDRRIEATGEHAFEITSTTKAPTCTEKGVNELTCSVCGATKTDDAVPAIGHTEGEWKVTKEATSEAEGEETLYCKTCNEAMQTRAIEKLPEESNNTVLIVVVITVVVLAAAGVAAYFVLKNKKAK